ncbi:MAG: DUF481 domain-containing protein [Myxococcota bacterium]
MWTVLIAAAMAQTPGFQEAVVPAQSDDVEVEVEKPETQLTAELGFTYVSGNAVLITLNGGTAFSHRWKKNRFQVPITLNVGQSIADADGNGSLDAEERELGLQENARRFIAEPRYDRFLSERDSLFLVVGFLHDPFLGYLARPHEMIGYSRLLIDKEKTSLSAEIGFDFAQEFYVEGTDPNSQLIYAARLQSAFQQKLNDNVSFADTLEIFENVVDLQDFRLLNTATFSSKLSDALSLNLSHKLLFDNVPVENFRKTDQTTMVTLVATLI